MVKISISDAFDGGNGKLVKIVEPPKSNIVEVHVEIQPDVYTELEDIQHLQYFSFRATVECDSPTNIKYVLANADQVSYPEAWSGTTVLYNDTNRSSVDDWKRKVDTFYTEGKLHWEHLQASSGIVYFSYFVPYSYDRHLDLISTCWQAIRSSSEPVRNSATITSLGQTKDGRELECVTVGTGDKVAWVIHRQHPGETMAEFYAEGLLYKLLGVEQDLDEETIKVLELYTLYIVPNMCPDGAVRGHLRTNSVGANLNREWTTKGSYEAPTLERSPEVYHVLAKMQETGVDLFLDIHGDEELPYNFISGAEQVPVWGKRLESLHGAFVASYARSNSDMQQAIGYPPAESREQASKYLNVATNQICNKFDCLAMTLEMPFKDCLSNPDPAFGWSPQRARRLGASVTGPFVYIHRYLRSKDDFWTSLPAEDAYVAPTDIYEPVVPVDMDDAAFKPLKKRFYSDVHEGHRQGHLVQNSNQ